MNSKLNKQTVEDRIKNELLRVGVHPWWVESQMNRIYPALSGNWSFITQVEFMTVERSKTREVYATRIEIRGTWMFPDAKTVRQQVMVYTFDPKNRFAHSVQFRGF